VWAARLPLRRGAAGRALQEAVRHVLAADAQQSVFAGKRRQ
jgi:hypothetical protein